MSYTREDLENIFKNIIGSTFKNEDEMSSCLIETLKNLGDGEQTDGLAYLLNRFGTVPPNGEMMKGKRLDSKRITDLFSKVGDDAHRAFHLWIRKNPTLEDLAFKTKHFLDELADDDERSVALAVILSDRHVPYCQLSDPGPDIVDQFGDEILKLFDGAERGNGLSENLIKAKVTIMNILRRNRIGGYVTAMLWDVLNRQDSDAEKFFVLNLIIAHLQEEVEDEVLEKFRGNAIDSIIIGIPRKR